MKQVAAPKDCQDCTPDEWQWFGCGLHGFEGQSDPDCVYTDGAEYRTCPRTYLQHPVVGPIYADVEDYKRGAFGSVLDLENPYLEYLRAATAAMDHWHAKQQEQLSESHDG